MLCLLLLLTTAIIAQAADQEMIVAMKTGETHLSSDILESEHRWFQLQTASLSARYQYIANVAEIDASSRLQYQPVLSARFVFDGSGNYSIHAGVFPGQTFSAGWNQSGVGTGGAVTNVHVKQLYFEGKPFSGVEFQYGGLDLLNGESTEITSYDNDGYLTGQRITISRADQLYFDDISFTAGYLDDLTTPSAIKRFDRLAEVNFYQILFLKTLTSTIRSSLTYASEDGRSVLRQAVLFEPHGFRWFDALLFENYQRVDPGSYGFGIYVQKKIFQPITLGGGYAQVDRAFFNSDRFPQGKRFHLEGHVHLNQQCSITSTFTRGIGGTPPGLQNNRFELALGFNLVSSLTRN